MKYTTVSVKQLEHRKGKPWQARAKYKDLNGKWKETSKILKNVKGKKEAQRLAKEWLDTLNAAANNMPNADKEKTVDEVVTEYLEFQLTMGYIEKSTYNSNLYNYREYIKKYLGDYIFSLIDKTVLNNWLTQLYKIGLSQNTIHAAYRILKKVYTYYFETGEILVHPFRGVKMPKRGEPKVTHLTNEQMDKVLMSVYIDYEPQDAMYCGILLAFYAGLRRGEICGLRWNDIDFYKKTITVRTSIGIGNGKNGAWCYAKNPKTKSSARTFPMLPQLEEVLKQRKEVIKPKGSWFVIGNENEFMTPITYTKKFTKFVKRNNLIDAYGKSITPHDLRHNFATVGINAGMDIASLSLMLGHASRAMTLDIYGDANADALNIASIKLTDKFNDETEYFKLEDIYDEVEEDIIE